jgi:hypothetical protein
MIAEKAIHVDLILNHIYLNIHKNIICRRAKVPQLFELAEQYKGLLAIDPADMPENVIADTLEAIDGEFTDKATNALLYAASLKAEAQAIKDAETRMSKRRKALESKESYLRDYVLVNMQKVGLDVIECEYLRAKLTKSQASVVIDDESTIPAEFKTTKTVTSINKTAIKKAGGCFGAHLNESYHLRIS